ncbi:MAG: glycosyltransferase family 4 protein [Candidatus Pacebacteria bacterium]|nr:glycosyltransferase family 4 protein [Candidatus Paceibacterota bacterium]
MRVAVFYELNIGGARRAALELAKELTKKHDVKIFAVDYGNSDDYAALNHTIYAFHSPSNAKGLGRIRHDTWDLVRLAVLHLKITRDILSWKADCVFVHPSCYTQTPYVLAFLKWTRIPTCFYCQEPLRIVHDPFYRLPDDLKGFKRFYETMNRGLRRVLDAFLIHQSTMVLTNSHSTQKRIYKAYGLRAEVCYLGIDTSLFFPTKEKKKYDVLFVGGPVSTEGFDLLTQALQHMKTKLRTHFIHARERNTPLTDAELRSAYNTSRITMCLSRNETFGLTFLESLACGTPGIVIREGGYKETVLHGKTAFFVPPNAKEIAKTITFLLKHPKLQKELGENGVRDVRTRWTWEKSGKNVEKFLKNMMNQGR